MRSFLPVIAAATLAQAFTYPSSNAIARPQVKSAHFRRMPANPNSVCAPTQMDDADKYKTLSTTDVANAEDQLFQWAQHGAQIQNTGGTKGKVVTSGGVDAQVCNFNHEPLSVTTMDLQILFDRIDCGKRDEPQMGFGFYHDSGNDAYYVSYAPTGKLMNCFDTIDDLKGAD